MFGRHTARAMELVLNQVRQMVGRLDTAMLTGPQAVALLRWFSELERLAGAARRMLADRAVETNQWRSEGDRSPEHWLARQSGSTVGAARDDLDTARRLKRLPKTDRAVREGRLSATQASAVADAASVDPDAEDELLDAAPAESMTELRRRAERVKAAARSAEDEDARNEAIHRSRFLRRSVAADGAHEIHGRGTAAQVAEIWARLQLHIDAQFEQARREGRREAPEAYAFDGLLAARRDSGGSGASPAKMLVRVDLPALQRGTTAPGEICEIAGYGPIPVSVAYRLMNEAFLALVLTRGKGVLNVTHLGRQFTEHQKTALEWIDPECCVEGCAATVRLERDHRVDWADSHVTRVPDADRLCHHHHRLKTTAGWHLEPGIGKRRFVPPGVLSGIGDARQPEPAMAGPP